MRHFAHLHEVDLARLFHSRPQPISPADDAVLRAIALGATLYSPATRPTLAADIARSATQGVTSTVVCLEDAVADGDVPAAELNTVAQLRRLGETRASSPMVFVRVRNVEQIFTVVEGLGPYAGVLTGFVVPKITEDNGSVFLEAIAGVSAATGVRLFAMPVLEAPEIIHRETRAEALGGIYRLLDKYRDLVLAVRIGATDLSSVYGLRRPDDLTIYDVHLVAQTIADIVNVFGRADETGFVVTGPVWEHFSGRERIFKPQLRESPFVAHAAGSLRAKLVAANLDGLIREVMLDRANGLTGKSVIHPRHVAAVHALSVVTHEEYTDAGAIVDASKAGGGVAASAYGNKMNEAKPHLAWAQRTLLRAHVFGVVHPEVSFVDVLDAIVSR